jgi:predicted nucleic acid-binding Zn ribbon protein
MTMTRKTPEQAAADRRKMMLSEKPLVPDGFCHYCGWSVPKLAHWCSTGCAVLYEEEVRNVRKGV